jgi:hypothetical protein
MPYLLGTTAALDTWTVVHMTAAKFEPLIFLWTLAYALRRYTLHCFMSVKQADCASAHASTLKRSKRTDCNTDSSPVLTFLHDMFTFLHVRRSCFVLHNFWASEVLWSEFLATDPEVRVRFPTQPDFLRSSGSGTGSTQPREYNWGATWKKK